MGPGQNCTKTKLHGGTKLHKGSNRFCTKTNLHKDKFARRVKFARLSNLHGLGLKKNRLGLGLKIRVKNNRLGLKIRVKKI